MAESAASKPKNQHPERIWAIDWCPYATAVLWPLVMPGISLVNNDEIEEYFTRFPQIVTRVEKVVSEIHFAFRTDGIFIFSLLPKTPPKSKDDFKRLKVAGELVSHMIKLNMHHVHVYHGLSSSGQGRNSTIFLSQQSVRIFDYSIATSFESLILSISDIDTFKDKRDRLISDAEYVKSASGNIEMQICHLLERDSLLSILPSYTDSQRNVDRPALLKLRIRFSKNFDDMFLTIEELRNRLDVYFYPTVIYSTFLVAFVVSWFHFNIGLATNSELLLKGVALNLLGVGFAYSSAYLAYLGLKRTEKYRHWIVEDRPFPNLIRRILTSSYSPIAIVTIYIVCLFEFSIPFYEFAPDILKNLFGTDQGAFYILPWPDLNSITLYLADQAIFTGYFLLVIGYFTTFYIEWIVKRRRSLIALVNTAGVLKFGTIYSNVIERIYFNKAHGALPNICEQTTGGFREAISIIEDKVKIEYRKRWFRILPFIAGFGFLIAAGDFVSDHALDVLYRIGAYVF